MGMAASQARLLCLTARMHDLEYQAQAIQNSKLQLATQSDRVYEEYLEALDAQTLVLSTIDPQSGARSNVATTFNNLCSRNRLIPSSSNTRYALRDARGRIIVDDEIAKGYSDYKTSVGPKSAEAFAFFMIFGNNALGNFTKGETETPNEALYNEGYQNLEKEAWEELINSQDKFVREDLINIHDALSEITQSDDIYNTENISKDPEAMKKYNKLLNNYRTMLYKDHGRDIMNYYLKKEGEDKYITEDEYDVKRSDFEYYVSQYNQIQANCGAYIAISQFDGFNGDASNDSEWLTAMVESGQIMIEIVEKDDEDNVKFRTTSASSDTNLSMKETTTIDTTVLKKAEAKYEHDLSEIQRKDKKFDLTLSKIETERNAVDNEMQSVKKVMEDNIGRTFKIFS